MTLEHNICLQILIIYAVCFRIQGDTFAQAITLLSQVVASCSGSAFQCWSLFHKALFHKALFHKAIV